jgi:hypothetical protein
LLPPDIGKDDYVMKSAGAAWLARDQNNGSRRRFGEEVPPPARWAEAVAILTTALSTVAKLGDREASSIATSALIRVGESVPAVMRDPAVRVGIAVGAGLIEARPAPVRQVFAANGGERHTPKPSAPPKPSPAVSLMPPRRSTRSRSRPA